LIESIEQARKDLSFNVWAFVIMPDHVHLLIYPQEPFHEIEVIRQEIKAPPAQRIIEHLNQTSSSLVEKITRQRGKKIERLIWQSGGGYDRNIDNPATLAKSRDYIHLNPVRRGLVTRASDWKWSSARWYEGTTNVPLIPDPIPKEWLST
jgi:putative transposase